MLSAERSAQDVTQLDSQPLRGGVIGAYVEYEVGRLLRDFEREMHPTRLVGLQGGRIEQLISRSPFDLDRRQIRAKVRRVGVGSGVIDLTHDVDQLVSEECPLAPI